MNAIGAITRALGTSKNLWERLIGDFSDADLLVRPAPGSNQIAWQLGHIIASEVRSQPQFGAVTPPLPEGFIERHAREADVQNKNSQYLTKAEYLKVFEDVRGATLDALNRMTESDLDKPSTGPTAQIAPTIGALFLLVASHGLLHVGQVSVARRQLGKPVLF
ncbi:MAG: DinB family protein [Gemmataceae bacterium]